MAGKNKRGKSRKGEKGRGGDGSKPHPQLPTEIEWSEFEKELGFSSQRWGTPDIKSFWLLTWHSSEVSSDQFHVYAVHLDSPSNSPLELQPILRWHYTLKHYAYAILGFTLYMFGGEDDDGNDSKNVFSYDMRMALSSPSTTYLEETSIQPGPPMLAAKNNPLAVVIDDARICVFDTELRSPLVRYSPNFELFDTTISTWTLLPNPMSCDGLDPDVYICVISYCIHGSILIIATNCKGVFGINLQNPVPKWSKLVWSENIRNFPYSGKTDGEMWTWTMLGQYLCDAFYAVTRAGLALCYFKVGSPIERQSLISRYKSGMCLGGAQDDGYTNLCLVRAGLPYHETNTNLLVDILKLDATQCKWGVIPSDQSFTFSLTSIKHCIRIFVDGCFPFKIADMEEAAGQAAAEEKEVKNTGDEKAAGGSEVAKVENEVQPEDNVEIELANKPAEEAGSGEGSAEKATETVVEKADVEGGKGIQDVATTASSGGAKKENANGTTATASEGGHQNDVKPTDGGIT